MNESPSIEVYGEFIRVPAGGKCGECKQVHVYFVNVLGRVRCAGCAGQEAK